MAQSSDVETAEREAICAQLLPLVGTIARGLARVYRCVEYADVFQDGCIGMIRAVETYDPARGVPLEPYARKLIAAAIMNGMRERDPLSEHARRLVRDAQGERRAAEAQGTSVPSMAQMSTRLAGLAGALLMAHRANTLSLDAPLPYGKEPGCDWESDPSRIVSERDTVQRLRAAIDALTVRQRAVIAGYYFEQKTVQRVGDELDISVQRVHQLHYTALGRMRRTLVTK